MPGVSSEHNQQTKKSITGSGGVREPPCAPVGPKPSILMPEPQEKKLKLSETREPTRLREAPSLRAARNTLRRQPRPAPRSPEGRGSPARRRRAPGAQRRAGPRPREGRGSEAAAACPRRPKARRPAAARGRGSPEAAQNAEAAPRGGATPDP